jgi:hypothetical protein
VYEIYGTGLGPGRYHLTWKYGITRQLIPAQRPERQLGACAKYYGPRHLFGGLCTAKWLWIGVGWLQARTIEASYTPSKTAATARRACQHACDVTQEDG